jgi:isoleucyl-tRNA synthetase
MAAIQSVVKLGRQLRVETDLKVRQPLSQIHVCGVKTALADLILDELNIKTLDDGADEAVLCNVSYKANFKTLGRKCGPKMKAVAAAIAGLTRFDGPFTVEGVEVTADDVIVTRAPKEGLVVASEGAIVVGLETALTPALIAEGRARELVSHVQAKRKEMDLDVSCRIALRTSLSAEQAAELAPFAAYIQAETLAVSFNADLPAETGDEVDLNGYTVRFAVEV